MLRFTILLLKIILVLSAHGQIQKYTSSKLNLRGGPNTHSAVLTTIPQGTVVEMSEECDCDWISISYNGQVGYVSSKYLSSKKPQVNTTARKGNEHSKPVKHYTNSNGERVQSPTYYNKVPAGATALCRDGTYSFSRNRRGTCSHHGGVAKWL